MYALSTQKNAYHSPQMERSYQSCQDELTLSDKKLQKKQAAVKEKVIVAKYRIEMLKQRYMKKQEDIRLSLTQKAAKSNIDKPTKKDCIYQISLPALITTNYGIDESSRKISSPIEKKQKSSPNISQFEGQPAQQQTSLIHKDPSQNKTNYDICSISQKEKCFYQTSQQIVYQIISRRLTPQKKQVKNIQDDFLEETDVEEPIAPAYLPKTKNIYLPYDQQYAAYQDPNAKEESYRKERSIEQEIVLWLHHPQTLLADYIPIDTLITSEKANEPFVFTSKNSSFNFLISSMITQFVLKRKSGLSQTQKASLYNLSLQYFYSNANQLSSQFLLVLMKLGSAYLSKYSLFFKNSTEKYCHIILANKRIFSNEEKSMIVSFFTEERQLTCQQIAYLLLVCPNEKLLSTINTKSFRSANDIVLLLCSLHITCKQTNSYNGAYFKLINCLFDCISFQQDIIESILGHVNIMTVNERYYQIHKQVKLRLIGIASQDQNKKEKESSAAKAKENNSGGFKGYWNKAVDKIKTATYIKTDKMQAQRKNEVNSLESRSTES